MFIFIGIYANFTHGLKTIFFALSLLGKKGEKQMKIILKGLGWCIVLIVALSFIYFFWYRGKPKEGLEHFVSEEPTVVVQRVEAAPLVLTRSYIGTVIPIHSVDILPFISGFVEDVKVNSGQSVSAGDVMFVLQQQEYKAALDARYADILQATATYQNAETYYQRMKKAGVKAISPSDLDQAQANYLSSKAALALAIANWEQAKVNYNYTVIKAPISGLLGNVPVTKGDYVSPSGQALARLIQMSPIRVVFSITDKEYLEEKRSGTSGLFQKDAVRLRLADGLLFDIPGTVQFLDNQVSESTSSVQVFADFQNPNKELLSNAYVDVLVEKQLPDGILISQNAVNLKQDGSYVRVVDESNHVVSRRIEVGPVMEGNYVVLSGLEEGEFVVLEAPSRLSPQETVKIKLKAVSRPPAMSYPKGEKIQ